jgi:streptogramin lyase
VKSSCLIAVAVLLTICGVVAGQEVVSADGKRIVLSVGRKDGVKNGMTGDLCTREVIGGNAIETCSAQFAVVSVSKASCAVRLTRGIGRNVRPGYRAKFHEELLKPETVKPPKIEIVKPVDPATRSFQEADRAFESGDWRGALERYEIIVEKYPEHAKADLAALRIQTCRTRLDELAVPAPVIPVVAAPPPAAVEAEALAAEAEKLLQSGRIADAGVAAVNALRLDSTNPRARTINVAVAAKSVRSRFNAPMDVAVAANGWCYVADTNNDTIRKVADGGTTTVAGVAGDFGTADGALRRARFNKPAGVAVGGDGSVYVADRYNASIRRIAMDGRVSTVAGRNGSAGHVDGPATAARFNEPRRLMLDGDGTIYVADTGNHAIRKVAPNGDVVTIAASDAGDRMDPMGIVMDPAGGFLITDAWSHVVRHVALDGTTRVVAGVRGSSGSADGPATSARFNAPEGIAIGADGGILVADSGNHTIRRIAGGMVTTIAGRPGIAGSDDGIAAAARFNDPAGLAVDARGDVWVADRGNHTIRRLTRGFVSTPAGMAGDAGTSDGSTLKVIEGQR